MVGWTKTKQFTLCAFFLLAALQNSNLRAKRPESTPASQATTAGAAARPCCPTSASSAGWLVSLFDTSDFPPRWRCGTWTPLHGWVHVISDLLIWGAYASIPILLIYYIRRRPDVPFPKIFWLFAAFILACGTVHLIEAMIFWYPVYRVAAIAKMATAFVSWATVLALLPVIPRALAFPGIEKRNTDLRAELQRRLAVEEALREREVRLEAIVNSASDGIVTMNERGEIESINDAGEQMFGYARADAVGKRVVDLIVPPRLRDAHSRAVARVLESGESKLAGQRLELSALRADGSEFPVDIRIAVVHHSQGRLFVGRVSDLTESKGAEERFRVAVEAAPSAMVMVDREGRILMVNRQTEELFGYPRTELIGAAVERLVPERFRAHHPEQRRAFAASPSTRAMGAGRDLYGRRKDGSEFPIEIGLNPIQTRQGLVVLSAIVDITHRKRTEKELASQAETLRRQNSELSARNKDLDEFSYVASHDLQEPLRKLVSFSALLKTDLGGDLPEPARKDLEYITDAAKRMRQLVSDLLDLSRTGRAAMSPQRISLHECVDRAQTALAVRIEETDADIDCDPLPDLRCDPLLISQLYQNLIGNALKFCEPNRRPMIHLTAEEAPDGWILGVRDNGIGIKSEYAEQVFAPFKRLHGRGEYEGTGIGLAICKKAVERHGGRIWVESKPGVGSHFKFTLGTGVSLFPVGASEESPTSRSS